MDDEPGGLVDDQQVFVLEDNPQRNVLGHVVGGRWLGNSKLKRFIPPDLRRRVANRDRSQGLQRSVSDQRLQPLTRKCRNRICKRTIQPPS